jgi:hypothetical protein
VTRNQLEVSSMCFCRERRADAPYWPGRRALAALDALAWPLLCALVAMRSGARASVLAWVLAASCVWVAARRLRRAVRENHRYRFLSWWMMRSLLLLYLCATIFRCSLIGANW